jgi:hypothetical protein
VVQVFRRDYILGLIEQAAQAVARALRAMLKKQPEEAAQEVNAAYGLLSLDRELLLALDAASLRAHIPDAERREMAARILLCDAELHSQQGEARAALRRLRAARRLLDTLDPEDTPERKGLLEELARVTQLVQPAT